MKTSYQKSVLIVGNAPPSREPSDIDIAWMAGFFEGEGSVRSKKGKNISISFPQKDAEILFRIREFVGGSISRTTREETYLHTLNICGDNGRLFLQSIYSFMSSKRKLQIEAAGGLKLTGRVQWSDKTSRERKDKRVGMTAAQRAVESASAFKDRNREADREYQREYRKRNLAKVRGHYSNYVAENRDHVNALARASRAKRNAAKNLLQNNAVMASEVIQ